MYFVDLVKNAYFVVVVEFVGQLLPPNEFGRCEL
jgi:hypothetical protein